MSNVIVILTFVDENIHEFCAMAFKCESFICEIELIYTGTTSFQDHLRKFYLQKASCSFAKVFIHKSFQLYGIASHK